MNSAQVSRGTGNNPVLRDNVSRGRTELLVNNWERYISFTAWRDYVLPGRNRSYPARINPFQLDDFNPSPASLSSQYSAKYMIIN